MGACASVPKAMKEEAAAAAAPPPEEKPQVEAPAIVAVDAAVAKEEGGDDKKEEKEESQSLGTLLVEGESPKEKKGDEELKAEVPPAEEKPADATPPQKPAVAAA